MKTFCIIFLALFVLIFLFGNITVNGKFGKHNPTFLQRIWMSALSSLMVSVVIGLPILGIIYLIKH